MQFRCYWLEQLVELVAQASSESASCCKHETDACHTTTSLTLSRKQDRAYDCSLMLGSKPKCADRSDLTEAKPITYLQHSHAGRSLSTPIESSAAKENQRGTDTGSSHGSHGLSTSPKGGTHAIQASRASRAPSSSSRQRVPNFGVKTTSPGFKGINRKRLRDRSSNRKVQS